MTPALLTLTLAALLSADPAKSDTPRKPSPFAPSLPQLTEEEEKRLDEIIDRFILYDTGQLAGADAAKARTDFEKLGPEATFALIRGLNRAAAIEHSCPVVSIARKLNRFLATTEDKDLLEFARDNIGAGVGRTRHAGVLRDLRTGCMLRKNALARRETPGEKTPRQMTITELAGAAGKERGPRLKAVLQELELRRGDDVLAALGTAATSYEGEIQQLAREGLVRNLARETPAVVKNKLKDDRAEVRAAAAYVTGARGLRLGGDLIDLLEDDNDHVRTSAQQALVKLNRGIDLGPSRTASATERADAVKRWREWWTKQGGR